MHDPTLDRTTTGKGKIAEVALDSIRRLKLKNGCSIRTIHNVPTLEEALMHAKGYRIHIFDECFNLFSGINLVQIDNRHIDHIIQIITKLFFYFFRFLLN